MKNYMIVTGEPSLSDTAARRNFAREITEICGGYTLISGTGGWINPKTCKSETEHVDVWHIGIEPKQAASLMASVQRYMTVIGERAAYVVYPDGVASLLFASDGETIAA